VAGGALAFYKLDPLNLFRAGPQAAEAVPAADGSLTVIDVRYVGTHVELRLTAEGCEILAVQRDGLPVPALGARARLDVAPDAVHVFAATARDAVAA